MKNFRMTMVIMFLALTFVGYGQSSTSEPAKPEITQLGALQVEMIAQVVPLEQPRIVTKLVDSNGNEIQDIKEGTIGTIKRDTLYEAKIFAYNLYYINSAGEKKSVSLIQAEPPN